MADSRRRRFPKLAALMPDAEQNDKWAVSRRYITLEILGHLGHHEDSPMAIATE